MIQRRREVQGGSIISFFPHWTLTSNPLHLFIRICEIMRKTTTSSVSSILKHLSAMIHPTSLLLIIFPLLLLLQPPITSSSSSSSWDVSTASTNKYYEDCSHPTPYPCGEKSYNISFPFGSTGRPAYCSYPDYTLTCDQENSRLLITMSNVTYQVIHINYTEGVLTVADADFSGQDCPDHFKNYTTTINDFLFSFIDTDANLTVYTNCKPFQIPKNVYLIPCLSSSYMSWAPPDPGMADDCGGAAWVIPMREKMSLPIKGFGDALQHGFDLTWWHAQDWCDGCLKSGGACGYDSDRPFTCFCQDGNISTCGICGKCSEGTLSTPPVRGSTSHPRWTITLALTAGISSFLSVALLCLCYHRKICKTIIQTKLNNATNEAFMIKYGSLAPKRYAYSDLKKITNSFSIKLGQGGYGIVFKGNLPDGCPVAVKRLSKSNHDGEEFINEVACIGRTSHVNIVRLLGFCLDGSKRALVYEFMDNGSLDKFIFTDKLKQTLRWEQLYEIASGIAQGLEYLHRGCNTRIVHFDIKPHNILLDKNLRPKISDFGLAKLCPQKESALSMAGARGTIGYIAPEVFSRSFGVVTSKSDVYSYGMMVLEMAGGRKNIDTRADNTSEIYFPHWVYEHLERDGDLHAYGVTTETEELARKMILVGLWCIQTMPRDRPSMNEVVDMLQGSVKDLQMPPKPYLSSPARL